MRLLVVGASGFLGRNVLRAAARRGWEVTGTFFRSKEFGRFAREYGCAAIRHDLLHDSRRWQADACIYLAGQTDHLGSIRDPVGDFRCNVEALHRFVAGYNGGLVFLSSAAVYEGHTGPVGPRTCLHPELPYAISKLAAEHYLRHFAANGRLAWATILRLYYAYGPFDRATRLIPRLVHAASSGEEEFVVTAPRGVLVDPLYAEDVARALLAAARGRARNETLDLCGGNPTSVPNLVRRALSSRGWRLRLVHRPRSGEAPLRFYSEAGPARKELDLGPWTPFAKGFALYVRWRDATRSL